MKSFSEQTKTELINYKSESRCCIGAELSAMLIFGCQVTAEEIRFVAENRPARQRFALLCKECGISAAAIKDDGADSSRDNTSDKKTIHITGKKKVADIVKSCNIILNDNVNEDYEAQYILPGNYLKAQCCRRAFLRGAFMASGTVVDPQKNYNLELITWDELYGQLLLSVLKEEGFDFKTVRRKAKYVLYNKTSGGIQDFLLYIGAYQSQMQLINITIEKEMRNDFVRSINSESANLDKTIDASVRQIKAINVIAEKIGLSELPEELIDVARLRLENRSMSLGELGKKLLPPLGKSGVNHRMKKLEAIAEKLEKNS